MTVEVDQNRVDKELRNAARKLAGNYRIPGFRKGKAPYAVVTQYVGLPNLFNEFIEPLGQEVFKAAIEQEQIEPYAMASLDVQGLDPLTYLFAVPLEPEVDLGDYRSLRVEEEPLEVDESEVEAQLESYRSQHAAWTNVDRPTQYGDIINIDVHSVLIPEEGDEDEEATQVLNETDWEVTPDEENPMEPPGFDAALIGLTTGQETEFDLSWPEESQSIYAGRRGHFTVTVKAVQSYESPELNDEFAQLVGPDFATIDELTTEIRNTLLEQKKAAAESSYLGAVLDALLEQSTLVYPPVVVEDQLDVMMDQFARQLRQYGLDDVDRYFEQSNQSKEEYRESMREQAEIIGQRNLLISELYRREGIEVSEDDINARITEMLGDADGEENAESNAVFAETMRSGAGRSVLESQLLQEKTVARLLAIARGEEVPPIKDIDSEAKAEAESEADSETDTDTEAEAVAELTPEPVEATVDEADAGRDEA
ncbi:MAG: trigger factor [Caldilineaceae bacterium]|nr:trigger factor [Caldilineaceae bacterium]